MRQKIVVAIRQQLDTKFGRQRIPIRSVIKCFFIIAYAKEREEETVGLTPSLDFTTFEKGIDAPL